MKKRQTNIGKQQDSDGNFLKHQHLFQFLKEIDTFGVPLKTYFHRDRSSSGEKETHEVLGSYFGGVTTLLCYAALSIYLYLLASKMYQGENDNITTVVLTNPLDDESNSRLNINKMKFLPYLEID